MRHFPLLSVLALLVVGFPMVHADEPAEAAVKAMADKIAKATIDGDAETVIDSTYPTLVELLGGRKSAIDFTKKSLEQMRNEGFTFDRFEASPPKKFYTEGKNTFAVLPTKMEMSSRKETILGESYLLGISSDGGKTWKFLDGSGMKDKALRKKILPKLPEKLVLPTLPKPKLVTKEKS